MSTPEGNAPEAGQENGAKGSRRRSPAVTKPAEGQATAGDAPAETKKKGRRAGSKNRKKAAAPGQMFDPSTLPPVDQLPLPYLISAAKYLRTVKEQIDSELST